MKLQKMPPKGAVEVMEQIRQRIASRCALIGCDFTLAQARWLIHLYDESATSAAERTE